jgi:hypothetical protein
MSRPYRVRGQAQSNLWKGYLREDWPEPYENGNGLNVILDPLPTNDRAILLEPHGICCEG